MEQTKRNVKDIAEKVRSGERLSYEEGLWLYESCDIHTLGELANFVRERLHGRTTYYNVNRHINYTNYCVLRCKFCSFSRPYSKTGMRDGEGGGGTTKEYSADGGYTLSLEDVVAQAQEAANQGATEVHIVGGLHPRLPFTWYLDLCRRVRDACPRLHIKAFTAIEIVHFARMSKPKLSVQGVLQALREAGLGSLPGGGAEIFDDRVHEQAYKNKVGEKDWFDVHRTAHALGIFSNATMLYGHVETLPERLNHLIKLRDYQDVALAGCRAHFNCVIPLPFIPRGSSLSYLPGPTGMDNLRTLAVTRLMLDNVPHVKAFWVLQTPQLAQVSLNWGVDDFDGTVVQYGIATQQDDNSSNQALSVERIRQLITEAGGVPIERDTLYRRVARDGARWHIMSET